MRKIVLGLGLTTMALVILASPVTAEEKAVSKVFGGSYGTIGEFLGEAVIPYAIALAAIGAVVMIAIAGNTYVSSGGAPEAVSEAKEMIIGALLGLATIVLAGLFVKFFVSGNVGNIASAPTGAPPPAATAPGADPGSGTQSGSTSDSGTAGGATDGSGTSAQLIKLSANTKRVAQKSNDAPLDLTGDYVKIWWQAYDSGNEKIVYRVYWPGGPEEGIPSPDNVYFHQTDQGLSYIIKAFDKSITSGDKTVAKGSTAGSKKTSTPDKKTLPPSQQVLEDLKTGKKKYYNYYTTEKTFILLSTFRDKYKGKTSIKIADNRIKGHWEEIEKNSDKEIVTFVYKTNELFMDYEGFTTISYYRASFLGLWKKIDSFEVVFGG